MTSPILLESRGLLSLSIPGAHLGLRKNFGLISAPRLPQTLQTKSGSTSDSLMLSGQRSGVAHFAEGDFLRIGRHGTYLGTMHLRATVFRTASVITTADPLTISYLP